MSSDKPMPERAESVNFRTSNNQPMTLQTLQPAETWDPAEHASAIETLRDWRDDLTIRIWCGDWCQDCQRELPSFGAALQVANVPESAITTFPVEKDAEGSKHGPKVTEYGIDSIPTVILEREGQEIARYVEPESNSILEHLVAQLRKHAQPADIESVD